MTNREKFEILIEQLKDARRIPSDGLRIIYLEKIINKLDRIRKLYKVSTIVDDIADSYYCMAFDKNEANEKALIHLKKFYKKVIITETKIQK